jgi:hypothetical protein
MKTNFGSIKNNPSYYKIKPAVIRLHITPLPLEIYPTNHPPWTIPTKKNNYIISLKIKPMQKHYKTFFRSFKMFHMLIALTEISSFFKKKNEVLTYTSWSIFVVIISF